MLKHYSYSVFLCFSIAFHLPGIPLGFPHRHGAQVLLVLRLGEAPYKLGGNSYGKIMGFFVHRRIWDTYSIREIEMF